MQISNIGIQSNATEWLKKAASEESIREKKEKTQKKGKAVADYDISISANAGNSSEALVKARANALPEIREERIAPVKERLQNGYYNTPEFNKELAERLIEG